MENLFSFRLVIISFYYKSHPIEWIQCMKRKSDENIESAALNSKSIMNEKERRRILGVSRIDQ